MANQWPSTASGSPESASIPRTSTWSTEVANSYDTVRQNCIKIVDEFAKAQPQYAQSVSNLQLNWIAVAKDNIKSMVSAHRLLASNGTVQVVTPPYTDEFVKRSNEITENIVKGVRINNQMTVNAINTAAENLRTLNQTIESVTEYDTNAPAGLSRSRRRSSIPGAAKWG